MVLGRIAWALMLAAVLLFCGLVPVASAAPRAKPNVIWIVADDLGYGDLGCYGCTDIPTPHVDALAKQGVRFTSAYAYPTCSPTRAALLTGQYAERFGVTGALMGDNPPNFGGAVTVAQMLKDNGYATAAVGKWHLGYTGDVTPLRKGFAEFYGFRGGKIDFFKHTDTAQKNGTPEGKHDFYDNDTEIFPKGYTTDLFTDRACKFLRDHKDAPFFLYLAYNAPHYAKVGVWQAPDDYLNRFGAAGQTKGRGVYAAMVSCLDDGIGKVLAQLHDLGLDDDTLVVFTSDNGGEGAASNRPFSGGKHKFTEGGLRVDQIWRLPGTLKAGAVRADAVHVVDLTPTVLAAVGVTAPAGAAFDGADVWANVKDGTPVPARPLYLGNGAIRAGHWKLLDGKLYDVAKDPAEKSDVAAAHPDVVQRLKADLNDWQAKVGTPTKKRL
jgi:arylsulfatase A-like enzyme